MRNVQAMCVMSYFVSLFFLIVSFFRKSSVVAEIEIKYFNELYQGITKLYDAIYVKGHLGQYMLVKPISLDSKDGK